MPRRWAALIDQGVISGSNFLFFLHCARTLDAKDWGAFGFAYAGVLFAQGFQRAIVTIPMVTLTPSSVEWSERAPYWARLNIQFSILTVILSAAIAGTTGLIGIEWLFFSAVCATCLALPLLHMEFCRRATIQHESYGCLVMMAIGYAIGIVTIAVVWQRQWEIKWMPLAAITLGSLFAVAIFHLARRSKGELKKVVKNPVPGHRSFSVWAVLSHLGYSGYNFGIQALLGAISGPSALGIFHACRALLQPVNTLIGAMDSVDKPRAARDYLSVGRVGLFAALRAALKVLVGVGGTYIIAVHFFDTQLLALAYGQRYADQEAVVLWWCIVAAITIFSQPIESGLYVINRTRLMFFSRLFASTISLTLAFLLIGSYGAIGALMAIAAGYATSAVLGSIILARLS